MFQVNYKVRINKVLCTPGNPIYINQTDCHVKLMNRTLQLVTIVISLHTNVSLTWAHVRIKSLYYSLLSIHQHSIWKQYSNTNKEQICMKPKNM